MKQILNITQLDEAAALIPQSLQQRIRAGGLNRFECHADVNLISFERYDFSVPDGRSARITAFHDKENLVFLCEADDDVRFIEKLFTKEAGQGSEQERTEHSLYQFFNELITGDTDYLERLEEKITETDDGIFSASNRECVTNIIAFRRELLRLKRYYDQLNTIFEGLMENENKLISHDSLRYFRILNNKIDRLYANVLNLRDYVTQVREAYQAQIDIEQNNLMKIFTVVTSIFLPLTLIAGWYGMNLQMPEFNWRYGYAFVIGLSAAILCLLLWIFRRKKWF
ncbi:MAG: CorA family divalent cation transporter [Oscillospiraceae bacterium]